MFRRILRLFRSPDGRVLEAPDRSVTRTVRTWDVVTRPGRFSDRPDRVWP